MSTSRGRAWEAAWGSVTEFDSLEQFLVGAAGEKAIFLVGGVIRPFVRTEKIIRDSFKYKQR